MKLQNWVDNLYDFPVQTRERQSKLIMTPWHASYLSQTNATYSTVVLKCMFGWAEILLCKRERVRVKLLRLLLVCLKKLIAGCFKHIHVWHHASVHTWFLLLHRNYSLMITEQNHMSSKWLRDLKQWCSSQNLLSGHPHLIWNFHLRMEEEKLQVIVYILSFPVQGISTKPNWTHFIISSCSSP